MAENEETPQPEEAPEVTPEVTPEETPEVTPEAATAATDELIRSPLRGEVSRRGLFSTLGMGWALFTGASALGVGAMKRFLFPNVLYEPPQQFKAGYPDEFTVGSVDLRFKATYAVWIVREPGGFYALSTTCTHLGCTPNWLAAEGKFKCPCHGSGFIISGINVEGPAPRPLERYKIGLAADGQIEIDKNTKYQEEKGQWTMEGAYLSSPA